MSDPIITGPGIADNAIGLAAVVGLPRLLEHLGVRLKDDLLLLANVRSLGRGNLEGARSFLETKQRPIRAGICVEGATQGRLSYSGLGTHCEAKSPFEYRAITIGMDSVQPVQSVT